jgi:fucose permease
MGTKLEEEKQSTTVPSIRTQLSLVFFAFILIGSNDGALGVLIPSLRTYYAVNKATIGLIFLASTIGFLTAAFISGLLLEALGRRLFLVVGASSFVVSAALISLRPPFVLLLGILLLLGFGVAILDAGLNTYIAGLPRSTALLNYLHAFYGFGALLGPIMASTILSIGFGWNVVYVVFVLLGLIVLVGFALSFKIQKNTAIQSTEKVEGNTLLLALKMRVVWLIALFLLFYVGGEVSLGNWSYSFLTEQRHAPLLLSSWIVSGYWFGLTMGRLTLARLAQRIGEKRLIQGCLVGVVVGVLLVWLIPGNIVSAFGLCLTGFSLGPIYPTAIALTSKLITARFLPSAIGFIASMGSMGVAIFPWLAGNLAQAVGLWTLLPFVIVLTIGMSLFWLLLQTHSQTEKG